MPDKGVSEILYKTIRKLMSEPLFDEFLLGGGTNLAIKHNHRVSTDIDLFSTNIVGTEKLNLICDHIAKTFGSDNVQISKQNFESQQLAWLQIFLVKEKIKIDIIQNLKLLHEFEMKDDIRLIHDIDIGSLKLLAAADRGHQKDFYDLYLLVQSIPLEVLYDTLQKRVATFSDAKDKTIFDVTTDKPIETLQKDLTALGDFTRAGNKKQSGNRIILTENSATDFPWPVLRQKWVEHVKEFAKARNLIYKETDSARKKGGFI